VLKCKNRVRIEHLWENQQELPSDKESNRSRGATRDIGRGPLSWLIWGVCLFCIFILYMTTCVFS